MIITESNGVRLFLSVTDSLLVKNIRSDEGLTLEMSAFKLRTYDSKAVFAITYINSKYETEKSRTLDIMNEYGSSIMRD